MYGGVLDASDPHAVQAIRARKAHWPPRRVRRARVAVRAAASEPLCAAADRGGVAAAGLAIGALAIVAHDGAASHTLLGSVPPGSSNSWPTTAPHRVWPDRAGRRGHPRLADGRSSTTPSTAVRETSARFYGGLLGLVAGPPLLVIVGLRAARDRLLRALPAGRQRLLPHRGRRPDPPARPLPAGHAHRGNRAAVRAGGSGHPPAHPAGRNRHHARQHRHPQQRHQPLAERRLGDVAGRRRNPGLPHARTTGPPPSYMRQLRKELPGSSRS